MEKMSASTGTPRLRIELKVSREQKELFERAAAASRQGISEFVRAAAERAARQIISDRG